MLIDRMAMTASSPSIYGYRRGYANIISDPRDDSTYILPHTMQEGGDTLRHQDYARLSDMKEYMSSAEFMEALFASEDHPEDDDYDSDEETFGGNYAKEAVRVPIPAIGNRGEPLLTVEQITDVSQVLRSALVGADTATYIVGSNGFLAAMDAREYTIIHTSPCSATEAALGCVRVGDKYYTPVSFTKHHLTQGATLQVKGGEVIVGHSPCVVVGSAAAISTDIVGYSGVPRVVISRGECSGSLLLAAHAYKRREEEDARHLATYGMEIPPERIDATIARVTEGTTTASDALSDMAVPRGWSMFSNDSTPLESAARTVLEEAARMASRGTVIRSGTLTRMYIRQLSTLIPDTQPTERASVIRTRHADIETRSMRDFFTAPLVWTSAPNGP